jgi:starvation-inducible outer membrane lipoprotein
MRKTIVTLTISSALLSATLTGCAKLPQQLQDVDRQELAQQANEVASTMEGQTR